MWLATLITGLAAIMAQAPVAAPAPVARVERNIVHYSGGWPLHVTVPAGATYLGADRFMLNGTNDCELHVYVEANAARQVQRFYWVHFESIVATRPGERMHYGDTDRRGRLWGDAVWISATPSRTARTARPGSDTDHFRELIRRAGYTMPDSMMTIRLVRLLDDPAGTGFGRHELMLIYGEDLAPSGLNADTAADPRYRTRFAAAERQAQRRAERSFGVTGPRRASVS